MGQAGGCLPAKGGPTPVNGPISIIRMQRKDRKAHPGSGLTKMVICRPGGFRIRETEAGITSMINQTAARGICIQGGGSWMEAGITLELMAGWLQDDTGLTGNVIVWTIPAEGCWQTG